MGNKSTRPWYLTTFLVLTIVYNILNAITLAFSPHGLPGYEMPVWYTMISVIFEVIVIVGLVSIFWWKRMGLYIATAASLVSVIIDYIAKPDLIVLSTIVTMLPLIIIYFCMRPTWSNFK